MRILPVLPILLLAASGLTAQSNSVNITVSNQVNPQAGVKGRLQLAMSTSFQLAEWSYQFFDSAPQAGLPLTALNPWHTRVQVIAQGVPLTGPDTWDFSELDTMLTPIQASGDHSPEFQIGTAPAFLSDASGQLQPSGIPAFAQMSANLVRYYNTGGFDDAGKHYQSPSPYPVTWWGIFNEPDINGVSASEYVALYNATVPAMAQADPTIKFVAVELAGGPEDYLPVFAEGVNAPVDVVAKHFYATCRQLDPDQTLFAAVPEFAREVVSMYQELSANPKLASVPVWITENNVNADYDQGNGISACNAPQKFVLDLRGSSAFFAAWRSLVFQQLGNAGAQALYQWSFGTDPQFGEVDGSGNPFLSYWVDYYLAHWLPTPPGQDILRVSASGCCAADYAHGWLGNGGLNMDTQTMAVRNADGSIVILMSNYALASSYDNNGAGAHRTFVLDLSALGNFNVATLVTLDATTPQSGPAPQSLTASAHMQVTLPGYGAALLRLYGGAPVLPAAGIVNAASFAGGAVAPGEMVSLFGSALGPAAGQNLELTNPWLVSNALAGVHVWFDGIPAVITYASAGQVNAIVPFEVAGKSSATVQVEYLGAMSQPLSVPVAGVAPGVFTATATGSGQAAILNVSDGSVNSAAHPTAPGEWVSIFGTGAGITDPASFDGLLAGNTLLYAKAAAEVTIGGMKCNMNYTGGAPGLVSGVFQINAQVPPDVAPGTAVPLVVKIGGVPAQSGITLAVAPE